MSCRVLHRYWHLPGGFALHLTHEVMALSKAHRRKAAILCAFGFVLSLVADAAKIFLSALLAVLLLSWLFMAPAQGAEASIPVAARQYRAVLTGVARGEFGLSAPVALLAAQIHQESRWNANAVSHAGAQGMAQFMPATARWLPSVAPHTGKPMPFNPAWSIRALCAYDKHLHANIKNTARPCDRWAFALCGYNGGAGWVERDRAKAQRQGRDPRRYWGSVEHVNAGRSAANFKENRGYPKRIFALQRLYENAGWGAGVYCD